MASVPKIEISGSQRQSVPAAPPPQNGYLAMSAGIFVLLVSSGVERALFTCEVSMVYTPSFVVVQPLDLGFEHCSPGLWLTFAFQGLTQKRLSLHHRLNVNVMHTLDLPCSLGALTDQSSTRA